MYRVARRVRPRSAGIYQQTAPQLLPRDDHSPTNGVRTYGVRRNGERRRDPWPPVPWNLSVFWPEFQVQR
jgi:hypothetical protein